MDEGRKDGQERPRVRMEGYVEKFSLSATMFTHPLIFCLLIELPRSVNYYAARTGQNRYVDVDDISIHLGAGNIVN